MVSSSQVSLRQNLATASMLLLFHAPTRRASNVPAANFTGGPELRLGVVNSATEHHFDALALPYLCLYMCMLCVCPSHSGTYPPHRTTSCLPHPAPRNHGARPAAYAPPGPGLIPHPERWCFPLPSAQRPARTSERLHQYECQRQRLQHHDDRGRGGPRQQYHATQRVRCRRGRVHGQNGLFGGHQS